MYLSKDAGTLGYYGYDSDYTNKSLTTFVRTIKITPASNGESALIKVTVSWTSRSLARSFSLSETIYNSYQ